MRSCVPGRHHVALSGRDGVARSSSVPVAANAKFTEDTQVMKLGEGAWKTVTKLRPYRVDFIDVQQGVVAVHTVMEENGTPVLFAARLKVVDRKLHRDRNADRQEPRGRRVVLARQPQEPTATMRYKPTAAERMPRAQMIEIAARYPTGLKIGSFVKSDVPFAPNAYRFENGVRMAGPGCTFQPPSCENMKTQNIPTLAGIKQRLVAVDEEMGVVLFRLEFGKAHCLEPMMRRGSAWRPSRRSRYMAAWFTPPKRCLRPSRLPADPVGTE
jgi:hypothetical protein